MSTYLLSLLPSLVAILMANKAMRHDPLLEVRGDFALPYILTWNFLGSPGLNILSATWLCVELISYRKNKSRSRTK